MNNMVTIIIPMYNSEKYIDECLNSLKKQTYKNFEIILVNDGSTDNSVYLVKRFVKHNPNITVNLIEQKNKGVSSARNKAIEKINGDYIMFLDADDTYHSNYIEEMYMIINKNNSDVCITSTNKNILKFGSEITSKKALKLFLHRKLKPGIGSFIISSEIVVHNNIKFIEGVRYSEDILFIYYILLYSDKISLSNYDGYVYRIHDDSVMSKFNSEERLKAKQHFLNISQTLKDNENDFYEYFSKYALSRWIFAVLWQLAISAENYKVFKKDVKQYEFKKHVKKLICFNDFKVSVISLLFIIFPRIYYMAIKMYKKRITSRDIQKV